MSDVSKLELIDRDALLDKLTEMENSGKLSQNQYRELRYMITSAPQVFPPPVRRGKWNLYNDKISPKIYECTLCKAKFFYAAREFNFCPECGARMDTEVEA